MVRHLPRATFTILCLLAFASLSLACGTRPSPDGSNAPLMLQNGQLDPIPFSRNIYREYVWGPGDNGFDEILLQTDELDDEYWCIQDGGGDLVALVTVTGNYATVVRQWTYDAYGAVLTAEHLGAALESHIGHKGLFVERLDLGVGDAEDPESPRLVPHAHALYHNRNRTYAPALGRFLQPDPNQTAMALLSVTASHGRGMYGDGLNLYQYLGSNPWARSDPLGLTYDPFDIVDEFLAERAGSAAALLDRLGQSAQAAAVVAATIAAYIPVPAVAILGDLALAVLNGEELTEERIMQAVGMGIIPGGRAARLASRQAGRIFASTAATSARYGASGAARGGGTSLATSAGRAGAAASATLRWLNQGPKNYMVYLGIENGRPVYVGITHQKEQSRRSQHNSRHRKKHGPNAGNRFDYLEPLVWNLTHKQALAIETTIKLANPQFQNGVIPIGPTGKYKAYFQDAVTWGISYLKNNGIPIGGY